LKKDHAQEIHDLQVQLNQSKLTNSSQK